MGLFKQKASYSSRPLEWLRTGGRANVEFAYRFYEHLRKVTGEQSEHEDNDRKPKLLAYRDDFRRLIEDETYGVLQYYVRDGEPLIRAIGVWLLGHCANRCQLLDIDKYRDDPSPMVRKHVAKALYRLEARQHLREMAARYPEEVALQWFAKERPNAATFEQRLQRFSQQVDQSQVDEAAKAEPMTFWARFEEWFLSPAKSGAFIRRILERIRTSIRESP